MLADGIGQPLADLVEKAEQRAKKRDK
jgi:hypothetical protein